MRKRKKTTVSKVAKDVQSLLLPPTQEDLDASQDPLKKKEVQKVPKRKDMKVIFKTYDQHQPMLLPPSLDELITADHPVRVVNRIIDNIDLKPLEKKYKAGGTSSFSPSMLLKVFVYAYMNNIYSSRKIESALKENVHFMWLAAMNTPDHNTINRFRGERLKEPLKKIFTEVVELLVSEGLLSLKELYLDGTKVEACANRYTFVWGKSIKNNKEKIKKQLNEVWEYAQKMAAEEMKDTDPPDFDKIDAEKVEQTIEKINEALKDKPVSKEIKNKINLAKTKWPEALRRYDVQESIVGEGRTSYSKTDRDATFMRMKEDHLQDGQLKPAYNVQIATNNQYIASYSIHKTPTDIVTLIAHVKQHEEAFNEKINCLTADAGYGSEENYQFAELTAIKAFIKHPLFDRQQKEAFHEKNPFAPDKLFYNKDKDCFYCPMGQMMKNIGTDSRITTTGFKQTYSIYQAQNCNGCPLRGACHKSDNNRKIEVNHNLNRLKRQADELLVSEEGVRRRKQRCIDVEPVFGNIKHNHQFRRFMLRTLPKVNVEMGLLALAHNLRKKCS